MGRERGVRGREGGREGGRECKGRSEKGGVRRGGGGG